MKLTFPQFSEALGSIESRNDPQAWGDNGQACGRWQEHPAFTAQWYPSHLWGVKDTWDFVFQQALKMFYSKAVSLGVNDVDAAVGFHLHGQPQGHEADAPAYAARFREAAAKLGIKL